MHLTHENKKNHADIIDNTYYIVKKKVVIIYMKYQHNRNHNQNQKLYSKSKFKI